MSNFYFTRQFLIQASLVLTLICSPIVSFSALTWEELLEKASSDKTAKGELYNSLWQGICNSDTKLKEEAAKFYRENQERLLPEISIDKDTILGAIKYSLDSGDWRALGKDGKVVYGLPEIGRNGGKWEGESFDLSISLLLEGGVETNIVRHIHPFVFESPISIKAPIVKPPSTFNAAVSINGDGRFFLMITNPQTKELKAFIIKHRKSTIELPYSWRESNLSCELHSMCPIDGNCKRCKNIVGGIWNSEEKLISFDSVPLTLNKEITVSVSHIGLDSGVRVLSDKGVSPPDLKTNNQTTKFSLKRHGGKDDKQTVELSLPLINWKKEYSFSTYASENEFFVDIPADVIRRYREATSKTGSSGVSGDTSTMPSKTTQAAPIEKTQTKKAGHIRFVWSNRVPSGTTEVYVHYRSKNNKKGLDGGSLSKAQGERVFELEDDSVDLEYGFTKSGIDTPDTWKPISLGGEALVYLPIEPIPYRDEKSFVRSIKRTISQYVANIKVPRFRNKTYTEFSKYLDENQKMLDEYFEHVRSFVNVQTRDPLCTMLIKEMESKGIKDPYDWTIKAFKEALMSIMKNEGLDKSELGTEHLDVEL